MISLSVIFIPLAIMVIFISVTPPASPEHQA